jgi:proteic killer suppression protein
LAPVIKRFRHRGLKRLYDRDDRSGLNPEHVEKIARILAHLDRAERREDVDLPGFRLHPLKGDLSGFWSITIRANWRIIFRFEAGDTTDVDYLDYH